MCVNGVSFCLSACSSEPQIELIDSSVSSVTDEGVSGQDGIMDGANMLPSIK